MVINQGCCVRWRVRVTPRHVTMAVVTRGHGPERRSDTAAAATAEMEHGDSELVARQQAECPGARTLSMEHTFYTHFQCHLGTVHLNQYCKEVFFKLVPTLCLAKWFDFALS